MERPPLSVRLTDVGRRVRRTNTWVIDAFIATALMAIAVPGLWVKQDVTIPFKEPGAVAITLTVLSVLPYYFRRRAPLLVLVCALVPMLVVLGLGYQANVLAQGLLILTYTVGAYCEAWQRPVSALVVLAGLLIAYVVTPEFDTTGLAFNTALFGAAFLFGTSVRNRRLYSQQLEERADALERERDEEAQRAVAEERLRIAQELHDVVAHSMGVIAVQAGVGAHVIDDDPAEAKKSLEAIATTSRSTLTEIRRLLGVLRADGGAAYQPAPGLPDLDRLVTDLDGAGLPVDLRFVGARGDVPPGVDLTAYRIVQEALTNVLKHAGPAHAIVNVIYERAAVRLQIVDDGRGVNGRATGGGHGLLGMRERVGVYGGTLKAGPRAGGGFQVAAYLPYGELE